MKISSISRPVVSNHTLSSSSSPSASAHNTSSVKTTAKGTVTSFSGKKQPNIKLWHHCNLFRTWIPWLSIIVVFSLVSMIRFAFIRYPTDDGGNKAALNIILPAFKHYYVSKIEDMPNDGNSTGFEGGVDIEDLDMTRSMLHPFPIHPLQDSGMTEDEMEFWKQPDAEGYRPCIRFSEKYRQSSNSITKEFRRYLIVMVNGGLNQQRNQIIDAVIIARIMEAAFVLPILEVNYYWGDDSEFPDIFDADHFKQTLKDDLRIVSALPSSHLRHFHADAIYISGKSTPEYLRSNLSERLDQDGFLILRALNSNLPKNLPSDLQKLRCKVAFHALRFAPRILELGNRISQRIWEKGPYVALHLRLEKDVWVRTGCASGLGRELDDEVERERNLKPYMLTAKVKMTAQQRKMAGLCPLNAGEVARLLKALGASRETNFFWAGGEPMGGKEAALRPFLSEFPHLWNKEDLALPGELDPFAKRPSILAAIDYLICLNSDIFINSHGGNMAGALKGHRAYTGHRKHITPNKRVLVQHFANSSLSERELFQVVRESHNSSLGQPKNRRDKPKGAVTAFPIPECMCTKQHH